MSHKHAAGHQKGKRRGTHQSTFLDDMTKNSGTFEGETLDELEEEAEGLGDFVESCLVCAAGTCGRVNSSTIS